jgi:dTDP-glucose 4,6-dehydratase
MILVTGGAGFIGSNFVKYVTDKNEHVAVIDKLTYAGNLANLNDVKKGYLHFTQGDINDSHLVRELLCTYHPRGIVHFAAESHVDNSINDASPFLQTNVNGTVSLLESVKWYLANRHKYTSDKSSFRFHHISTDEVYGSLGYHDPAFTEKTQYDPRSPYSASKAAADHFVTAYGNTYKIPYVITNCSNNYGPKQHPEKLIPTVIRKAMNDEPVPMYADGSNIRDWIHVWDHCAALWKVFLDAKNGSRYNIGGKCQLSNKILIAGILDLMGKPISLIKSVADRPGHDFR